MKILGLKWFIHTPFLSDLISYGWAKRRCSKEKFIAALTISYIFSCMSRVAWQCLYSLGGRGPWPSNIQWGRTKWTWKSQKSWQMNKNCPLLKKYIFYIYIYLAQIIQGTSLNITTVLLWNTSKQVSEHHPTFSADFLGPDCVQILALPFIRWATLSKLLNISVSPFHHQLMGILIILTSQGILG